MRRRCFVAADGGDDAFVGDEDVVQAHVVGAGTAQAAHMPGVQDLELALRHHGVAVALVDGFFAVVRVEAHGGAEEVRVVDAADELPLAGDAPAVAAALRSPDGRGGAGHDGRWIGDQLRAAALEAWADQAEGFDADHQIPAGAAVGPGHGLDDADLRRRIRIGAVDVRGAGKAVQAFAGERLGNRARQVALAFGLVGVLANQRCERLRPAHMVLGWRLGHWPSAAPSSSAASSGSVR